MTGQEEPRWLLNSNLQHYCYYELLLLHLNLPTFFLNLPHMQFSAPANAQLMRLYGISEGLDLNSKIDSDSCDCYQIELAGWTV
jgi:hypothetical protein